MAKRGKLALTDEVQKALEETYVDTGSLRIAAQVAGISHRTIFNWVRQAETAGKGSRQWQFVLGLRKARARRIANLYKKHAESKDPASLRWEIERHEKNAMSAEPVQEAWSDLTDDEAIEEVARHPRIIEAVLRNAGVSVDPARLPAGTADVDGDEDAADEVNNGG